MMAQTPTASQKSMNGTPRAPAKGYACLSADELRRAALGGDEVAVVDVRESHRYEQGHISIAVEVPLDQLEIKIAALVPRKSARLVVVDDDGETVAPVAAERLITSGYTDVYVLEHGLEAWSAQGYELIAGFTALSKALGEFVERRYHTPKIDVKTLRERLDAHEKVVVIDTRPLDEFNFISIPSGVAAPGAELLYRIFATAPSPDTPIVVNCAGRTRAIIGAQALLNAGIPNPVFSLENGTAAWQFEGFEPAHGAVIEAPKPDAADLLRARRAAENVAARFGVKTIDRQTLERFRSEQQSRSLYVFDVRTLEEYIAGHVPAARSAPGGQLVQATDRFIGTRQGRIVLVDDPDLVRATITASWLIQLGLPNIYVYGAGADERTEAGGEPILRLGDEKPAHLIAPLALKSLLDTASAVVIDLEPAPPYFIERRYIPDSLVARRSTLARHLAKIDRRKTLVLTSGDGSLAQYAAIDLAGHIEQQVCALDGGTNAWIQAGLPIKNGLDQQSLDPDEALPQLPTLEQYSKTFAAYVAWGDGITEQLQRDGLVKFRTFD